MKINVFKVWSIIGKLLPVVRKLAGALSKDSDGGKRITAEERDMLIAEALAAIGEILDSELPA